MFYFDPLYLILSAPVFLFSMFAQMQVKNNFNKFSKIATRSGMTGADVAKLILSRNGINIPVERVGGWLSDHYSPTERKLRLSQSVYGSNSIAAIGVAAHEAGHAIQHAKGYSMMKLWQTLAKPVTFTSNASMWLLMIGMFLNMSGLAMLGFLFFLLTVVFQIVTLPVEFDASNRAKKLLTEYGVLDSNEKSGVDKVLNSAAMTYIAAAAASLSQLLYFAIRLGLLGGRDD